MTVTTGIFWGMNAGAFGFTLGWAAGGHPISIPVLILQMACLVMGFISGRRSRDV